jgi:predicted metal-dependent peptidase
MMRLPISMSCCMDTRRSVPDMLSSSLEQLVRRVLMWNLQDIVQYIELQEIAVSTDQAVEEPILPLNGKSNRRRTHRGSSRLEFQGAFSFLSQGRRESVFIVLTSSGD